MSKTQKNVNNQCNILVSLFKINQTDSSTKIILGKNTSPIKKSNIVPILNLTKQNVNQNNTNNDLSKDSKNIYLF